MCCTVIYNRGLQLIRTLFYAGDGLDDLLRIPNSANIDPSLVGISGQEAKRRNVCLVRKDFLLYMATVGGRDAIRNFMIPRLMSSLRELKPDECITQACIETNRKIERKINLDYPNYNLAMIPKFECTFTNRFCITQDFHQKPPDPKLFDDPKLRQSEGCSLI